VYIDLDFYQDLRSKMGAPGDFAQAYVIAHEVGHHVQNLMGISDQMHEMRSRLSQEDYNQLSVRLELQADCLSGVWANRADRARQILEDGDIEEALNAASMIGDDRLQKQARGYVTPDSFTHGSSEQRVRWFKNGLASGNIGDCDTFGAQSL
jgi:predicted metalloprotease